MGVPGAIVGAGALSLVGGLLGSSSAKSAANTQVQASQYATDAQLAATQDMIHAQVMAAEMAAGATIEAARMAADATIEAGRMAKEATMYGADQNRIAIEKAIAAQERALNQARAVNSPYVKAGKEALARLTQSIKTGPGDFEESPGYQFRLEQGNKNVLANASATGNLASGRTMKALQEYGQDYASYEYDKFLARYYQSLEPDKFLTSVGQSAATLEGNQAMAAGSNIASANMAIGESYAKTGQNLANIYMNQGNSLAGIYGQQGAGLASIYSTSGSNLASLYGAQGNILANNYMNQGNANAAGIIGSSNAWTNAIEGALGLGAFMYGINKTGKTPNYNAIPSFGSTAWYGFGNAGSANGMFGMT